MQFSLKELRARMDWSQAETAKKIGTTKTTYNRWEQNPKNIKIKDAIKIANVFGVPIADIKID